MICTLCHQDKPSSAFYRGRRQCKRCRLDQKIAKYNPERQKVINARASWKARAWRYGTTEEALQARWDAQHHACAICGRTERMEHPHVDHCHATGKIRGLLCASCNRALGLLKDDPARFERAAEYLRAS